MSCLILGYFSINEVFPLVDCVFLLINRGIISLSRPRTINFSLVIPDINIRML